jgi:hypothetical protein
MFVATITLVYILLTISVHTSKSWTHQQLTYNLMNWKLHYAKRQPICLPTHDTKTKYIFILLISLSGDIEPNPGPAKKDTVYHCRLCEYPVTRSCRGVCCDGCNIWHHKSCIELCSQDYELLEKSNVRWICCKCEGINISTFTFRCYELETSNIYEHITRIDLTLDSIPPFFSSLKTSSPKKRETFNIPNSELTFNSRRSHHLSSNPYEVSAKKNLRIMTV